MATRTLTAILSQRGVFSCQIAKVHAHRTAPSCGRLLSLLHSRHVHRAHSKFTVATNRPVTSVGHSQKTVYGFGTLQKSIPSSEGPFQHGKTSPFSWCMVRGYAKKSKDKGGKGGKKKTIALSAEELEGVLDLSRLQEEMTGVTEDLKHQMIQQVSVRTNIGAYDNLAVKTEDGVFPLMQLGQVIQKNPSLILVNLGTSPQYIPAVKEALLQSGLNVNPQQDGTTIFIPVPKITREHREGLAKSAKMIHDKAKTRLRDIHNRHIKKVKAAKDHHSEDLIRAAQDLVLEKMHTYGQQLDAILAAKQQELLGGK